MIIEIFYFASFIVGLIVGSFLNCIIYRLEKGESFIKGRSYCPHCKHVLNWQDLIPIFSFLALSGECRYCRQPISWQYPLVDLATGIIFVLIGYYVFPSILLSTFYFLVSAFLIIIFVYDLKHYIIPDKVVYSGIIIAAIYQLFRIWNFENWGLFRVSDLGLSILPAFVLLAIILFSRGVWMGLGDFKLAILMGLFLGWPNILFALFSAFFLGAIIGVVLVVLKKKGLKSEIPFGPFLVTGTFLALFWGEGIINWYISLLF